MSELTFRHLTGNFPIWFTLYDVLEMGKFYVWHEISPISFVLYDILEMGKFHVWTELLAFDMKFPHLKTNLALFGAFWK